MSLPRSLCLWNTTKKKPIFTQALAHGFNEALSETEGVVKTPRWITALASLRYSDLIASGTTFVSIIYYTPLIFCPGSWEGDIRIWKLDSKLKSFTLIGKVPAPGVVNSLQLITPPKGLIETITWAKQTSNSPSESQPHPPLGQSTRKGRSATPFLLVAGLGQEHRLGRWLSVKEGGASNGAMVVAFSPRTLA